MTMKCSNKYIGFQKHHNGRLNIVCKKTITSTNNHIRHNHNGRSRREKLSNICKRYWKTNTETGNFVHCQTCAKSVWIHLNGTSTNQLHHQQVCESTLIQIPSSITVGMLTEEEKYHLWMTTTLLEITQMLLRRFNNNQRSILTTPTGFQISST